MPEPPATSSAADPLIAAISRRGPRGLAWDLFWVSFLGLFLELFLIRHLGTEIRVMAYFQNSVLIACFIGLGFGFRYARRPPLRFRIFIPATAIFFGVVLAGVVTGFVRQPGNPTGAEMLWGPPPTTKGDIFFYATFVVIFVAVLAIFAMVGQLTGHLFTRFSSNLKAYSINIGGSLAGILGFTLLSFFGIPPVVWLAVALLPAFFLLRGHGPVLWAGGILALLVVGGYAAQDAGLFRPGWEEVRWSPYQKVVKRPLKQIEHESGKAPLVVGFQIDVNQDYHQRAINLSDAFFEKNRKRSPGLAALRTVYGFPYIFKPKPGSVLIVGAGTGNDVAAALRAGATSVDAVEIDPVIAFYGRSEHPERPYDDPRVHLIIDDARAHLRRTNRRYDVIAYGLLDSHTQVSGLAQVRLDNFVYTVDAFKEARSHLDEDGIVAISFAANPKNSWLARRIHVMLAEAFGAPPLSVHDRLTDSAMFVAGPGLDRARLANPAFEPMRWSEEELDIASTTDDWPFFYMKERGIPVTYAILICVIGLIFFVIYRFSALRETAFSSHFFFLGAAFLLVEVKGITELALVFGSTWVVNGVAISAILLLILAANLWLLKRPRRSLVPYYAGLWGSLLLGFLLPTDLLAAQPLVMQQAAAVGVLFLPVFFAAVIFATSLDRTADVEGAFASNLIGAMAGGFLEYFSLVTGIKVLYLIALLLYVVSAYGVLFGRRSSAA